MSTILLRAQLLIAIGIIAALVGCATVSSNPADWPQPRENLASLQPGDILQIKFAYWPDLNEEQVIRPDGRIALQHIGEVEVGGRMPEDVRQELTNRYAEILKNPTLSMAVKAYASQRVYVGGEVARPGMVAIEGGRLSVVDAIFQAGGFLKESAKLSRVVVLRQRENKQYARSVDLKKAFKGKDPDPFYLEPYDIVYIPRTKIDRVNQWTDQYINRIVPDNVVFTFNKDLDRDEIVTDAQTFQVQLPSVQP